jgi:hypothetical protein
MKLRAGHNQGVGRHVRARPGLSIRKQRERIDTVEICSP